tara:strand:- start:328 stop:993 length:666 start_codon:yes stop_codon:yes gene_type:complete
MKKLLLILLCFPILYSCNRTNSNKNNGEFNKSYKKQIIDGEVNKDKVEYLDEKTKLYSNFKYAIAYKETKNWTIDYGSSEYTIFRAYEVDSGFTFSINVIELGGVSAKSSSNIHTLIDTEEKLIAMRSKNVSELNKLANINPIDYNFERSYIKNFPAIKSTYKYIERQTDFEYEVYVISYQVERIGNMYTFTLVCPYMFYEINPQYYEDVFWYINFLNSDY